MYQDQGVRSTGDESNGCNMTGAACQKSRRVIIEEACLGNMASMAIDASINVVRVDCIISCHIWDGRVWQSFIAGLL